MKELLLLIIAIVLFIGLHAVVDTLRDIRTITSEMRDTLNCMQTPADGACAQIP